MKSIKFLLILFFALISSLSFSQILQNVNKIAGTISKPITQIDSIRFNTSTNQMEIIQTNGNAENHVISDIINVTFSGQLIGTITSLSCGSAIDSGTLTAYIPASNVSSTISYTGGNGGLHNGQTVNSTGVTGLTATLASGSFAVGSGSLIYNITGTPNSNGIASFLINIGGITCILTRIVDLPVGIVSLIDCVNATTTGTLYDGTNASLVSSNISYTGGNGGSYAGQTVSSIGVTGLTATLAPGAFAIGNGSLTYIITGTPDTNGIASFMLNIGGQTCELTINVNLPIGALSVLDCSNASTTGSIIAYSNATGVNSSIPYSGGNGGLFNSQSVNSTGVTGLTAYIAADTLATGAGNLIYIISGTPNSAGTASFLINIGGQTCTLSLSVTLPVGTITNLNCGTATNTGTLTAGAASIGVSSSVPYTGGNGGTHNGQTVTSTGVTGLTATLAAGTFTVGAGSLSYTISGIPSAGGTASFLLDIGGQTCTLTRNVVLPLGTISTLSCGTATNTGTLTAGTAASGVSSSVPYTGGNGGAHNGQTVASTGVTGLTATLILGTFAIGSGNITYTISGTPSSGGTANFTLNIGGQSCVLSRNVNGYPAGTIHCNGSPTIIVDITNPTTGKTWMDRNLGASQVATSSTDINSFGDSYQWGRPSDGHQCRTSSTTTILSSSNQPGNSYFILLTTGSHSIAPYQDWRSPQNINLWQDSSGVNINNPCPNGYRIPTWPELNNERLSWSSNNITGAFASPLKFTAGGGRNGNSGSFVNVNSVGVYWSSTINTTTSFHLNFNNFGSNLNSTNRSQGLSVRCIKQ